MLKISNYVTTALAIGIVFCATAFAQQPSTTTAAQDNYVTEKSFKSKIFEVKYRDPNSLASVLRQLGSGFKGATISANSEFKTITARDFPENLLTMEEAIKRLDTPGTPRPNIELHMHVLIASNAGGSSSDMPAELKDVLTQLRQTLTYKNYELASSVVQRLTQTERILQGNGTAEIPSGNAGAPISSMPYEYYVNNVSVVHNAAGGATVQISDFAFTSFLNDKDRARIQTALNLRDGEKVVVGTATLRNRALVLVLTANVLK